MNIFLLDLDPKKCARYHSNKHVVSQIKETAQLLSTAVHVVSPDVVSGLYRVTHKNHPCSVWTRRSVQNFKWLCSLGKELLTEYSFRYNKNHKSGEIIERASDLCYLFPNTSMTDFAQAMPEEFRDKDPVTAYRRYYIKAKSHLLQYKNRDIPEWINETE